MPQQKEASTLSNEEFPFFCAAEHMEEEREQSELAAIAEEFNSASNNRAYLSVPVPHHIFYGTHRWMQTTAEHHPFLALTVFTVKADYDHLKLPLLQMKPSKCSVIVDSGCQSSLSGFKMLHTLGLKR